MKQQFSKQNSKVVIHQQQHKFRNDCFRIELDNELLNNIDYDNFIKTFTTVPDNHDQLKKKYFREKHANFMAQQLRKAIMKRSKLRNGFLKDSDDTSQSTYRKQCNLSQVFTFSL